MRSIRPLFHFVRVSQFKYHSKHKDSTLTTLRISNQLNAHSEWTNTYVEFLFHFCSYSNGILKADITWQFQLLFYHIIQTKGFRSISSLESAEQRNQKTTNFCIPLQRYLFRFCTFRQHKTGVHFALNTHTRTLIYPLIEHNIRGYGLVPQSVYQTHISKHKHSSIPHTFFACFSLQIETTPTTQIRT